MAVGLVGMDLRGFGLIEFMVVITLAALIAMVSLPLSSQWSSAASLQQAASLVQHLYTRTKALAISNPDNARAGTQAATLCSDSGTLYVQRATALTCGQDYVWSAALGSGITLTQDVAPSSSPATPFQCAALDALGLPVQMSLNDQPCSIGMQLSVHKGGLSRAVPLY
jgi:prepilin-type N-terminal cleavage/methylation domain-containing protein